MKKFLKDLKNSLDRKLMLKVKKNKKIKRRKNLKKKRRKLSYLMKKKVVMLNRAARSQKVKNLLTQ
jgi:hypothetical protein